MWQLLQSFGNVIKRRSTLRFCLRKLLKYASSVLRSKIKKIKKYFTGFRVDVYSIKTTLLQTRTHRARAKRATYTVLQSSVRQRERERALSQLCSLSLAKLTLTSSLALSTKFAKLFVFSNFYDFSRDGRVSSG